MRVLLKISWEALSWQKWFWICEESLKYVAHKIKELRDSNVEVAIVVWAWNLMRWAEACGGLIDRPSADKMWMLAIIMNGIALRDTLNHVWLDAELHSSFEIPGVCPRFNKPRAIKHIKKGRVIICVGWTWNPYFTTDTACVLRAIELDCDFVVKATQVDGLYTKDPNKHDDAEFIKEATFKNVISNWYRVMDQTAFALAMENNMKIKIVSFTKPWAIVRAISWEDEGTTIKD